MNMKENISVRRIKGDRNNDEAKKKKGRKKKK